MSQTNIGKALGLPKILNIKKFKVGDRIHLFANNGCLDMCYTVVSTYYVSDYVEIQQDGITSLDRFWTEMFNEYKVSRFTKENNPEYYL